MSEKAVRVATKLRAMAQRGVDRLSEELAAISAPPAIRAAVLEEMATIAMQEAATFWPAQASLRAAKRRRP